MLRDAKRIVGVFNVFDKGCAAIAGGCIRDIDTHRTPKDIDIIIHYQDVRDYRELEIQARFLGYECHYHGEGSGRANIDNDDDPIRNVITLRKEGKLPIDVIFMDCPVEQAVENFPCNAVMVWLEGNTPKSLPQYDEFIKTTKLVFYKRATDEYKARLNSYYPQD